MSRSVFSGLSLQGTQQALEVRYPKSLHDAARAERVARVFDLRFADGAEAWSVCGAFARLKAFFAQLNGYPPPYALEDLAQEPAPLVSCIVVVNENLPFVREQLLPSLAANSRRPVEVILVHNGAAQPDAAGIRSEWGAVAAGYNAGAKAARGRYLALFHDDVIVDDPGWIDTCLAALEDGAGAVSPEHRRLESVAGIVLPPLPVAKCVPLVMRADDFHAAGGFDEFHYVGYEDLDFSLGLVRRGLRLAQVKLATRHFSGMSSTLKYCPLPGLATLYALGALPPAAIRRRFSEFIAQGVRLEGVDVMRIGLDVQLLYVLKKYRGYLAGIDPRAYAEASAALERSVAAACPFDVTLALPRFRELDRAMRGAPA